MANFNIYRTSKTRPFLGSKKVATFTNTTIEGALNKIYQRYFDKGYRVAMNFDNVEVDTMGDTLIFKPVEIK